MANEINTLSGGRKWMANEINTPILRIKSDGEIQIGKRAGMRTEHPAHRIQINKRRQPNLNKGGLGMKKREVLASVKDERLVKKRRDQMIKGAVSLFKQKGFHRTTTREIAKAAGFSIGTLYEYIRTKEDVLYLVCDSIYDHVSERLQQDLALKAGTLASLKLGIANFFQVMDEMQAEVLVMYQEVKSLSKDALPYVLKKEIEMVAMFEHLLTKCVENGELSLSQKQVEIIAHNIFVQGQMWGFRRWALRKLFTLEEYTELQTELLLSGLTCDVSTAEQV